MPNCSVLCCRSRSDIFNLHRGGVSYHRFPTDPEVKLKWIQATGRKNWHPVKKSTICSKHFVEWDYLKEVLRPKILKKGTVPSQRLFYTDDGSIFIDRMENPEALEDLYEDAPLHCASCAASFPRAGAAVYRCLQCGGAALCGGCDAQHAPHCVVRVPSRVVYNKLKELWESLQHEIADRLRRAERCEAEQCEAERCGAERFEAERCGADAPDAGDVGRKRRAASTNKPAEPSTVTPTKQKQHTPPHTDSIPTPKMIPKVKAKTSPKRDRNKIINPFALLRDKGVKCKDTVSVREIEVDHVNDVESEEIEVLMDVGCFGDLSSAGDDTEGEPPDSESEEGEDPEVN